MANPGRGDGLAMLETVRARIRQEGLTLSEGAERHLLSRFESGLATLADQEVTAQDSRVARSLAIVSTALADLASERGLDEINAEVASSIWDRICPCFPFC